MPRVIITGARGFTGEFIADDLSRHGFDICETNDTETGTNQKFEFDITDIDDVERAIIKSKPDYVIHLAALSFAAHPNPKELFDVNLFGTYNLLKAVYKHAPDIKKVILASSGNVYGNRKINSFDETVCPSPENFYASSKLAMEHMAKNWFDVLPIIITRPFNYTGRGQNENFLVPKIVSHFKNKSATIELGNLEISRDFSDVRIVAEVYRLLLLSDARGEIVNICGARLISLKEIIQLVSKISKHNLKVNINPKFVRENEVLKLRGCDKKLESIIGKLNHLEFHETLSWMINPN